MNHVRGLVRRLSLSSLAALERKTAEAHVPSSCFAPACLVDLNGERRRLHVLNPSTLLTLLDSMARGESLALLDEAREIHYRYASAGTSPSTCDGASPELRGDELYVKFTTPYAVDAILERQARLIAKLRGRHVAQDMAMVDALVHRLLEINPRGDVDWSAPAHMELLSEYRGAVEQLCSSDYAVVMALVMNRLLPPVGGSAASALAKIVDISKEDAVQFFVNVAAEHDESSVAFTSCATHVGVRLRNAAWDVSKPESERRAARQTLALLCRGSVDPSVVFPTHSAMIEAWANALRHEGATLAEHAAKVLQVAEQHYLLPRRVALDTVSALCLTDVSRRWLTRFFGKPPDAEAGVDRGVREAQVQLVVGQVQAAVLKDVKRSLIDNRLLHSYANYLEAGVIEATHVSFPSFLEECGECHQPGERPPYLRFTLQGPPTSTSPPSSSSPPSQAQREAKEAAGSSSGIASTLMASLVQLAPRCSFWRTLLVSRAHTITAHRSPQDTVTVTVPLPDQHECVTSAAALPTEVVDAHLRILHEDEFLMVCDKPAGVATSRHALSVTQLRGEPVVDFVSLLLASTTYGDCVRRLFRSGQLHRLDTDTSGCLLVAKSDLATDSLRHQIGTSAVLGGHAKVYLALCVVLEPDLGRVRLRGTLRDPGDQRVTTSYRVVEFFHASRLALVECRIMQGKKHQIRRHLASAGMPILQDEDHGGAACCSPLIDRVALHASSVTFVHPATEQVMTVHAPLPADMSAALQFLRSRQSAKQ